MTTILQGPEGDSNESVSGLPVGEGDQGDSEQGDQGDQGERDNREIREIGEKDFACQRFPRSHLIFLISQISL
jgi:hypothetical protein